MTYNAPKYSFDLNQFLKLLGKRSAILLAVSMFFSQEVDPECRSLETAVPPDADENF